MIHDPCPGIEIEPRVWSGCSGGSDCPTCGDREHRVPIQGISVCAHFGGFHANGAGPCFDDLSSAIKYRDKENAKATLIFERNYARDARFRESYDAHGWPDRAWNTSRPGAAFPSVSKSHLTGLPVDAKIV